MTQHAGGPSGLTLTAWQQRVLRSTITWFSLGLGVFLGGFVAFAVAAMNGGNGVFGMPVAGVLVALATLVLMVCCMFIGVLVSVWQQSKAARLVREVLATPPAVQPVAPAVLVRVVRVKRGLQAHQLLYCARMPDGAAAPVLVPVPQGYELPQPASGAWLVLNERLPAFASFATAQAEQHESAAADPAFAKLTRVQRGLAVPGATYLLPCLTAVAAAVVSFAVCSVVLSALG